MELERLHEENHKLKHLLDEISERYNDLQSRVLLARPTQVEGLQQHEVLNCLNHKNDHVINNNLISKTVYILSFKEFIY